MKRTVFFISDGTGLTAEALGNSLITQFDNLKTESIVIPYVDNEEKANAVVVQINEVYDKTQIKPLVFSTLVNPRIYATIKHCHGILMDFFNSFLKPLEKELNMPSSHAIGRSHGIGDKSNYQERMEAINYTLSHDDGINLQGYAKADIIIVGVSRSGKTPTSLYLALQFGLRVANYPFTEEDMEQVGLAKALKPYKNKLFGLTISANRLHTIRNERRPDSRYAHLSQFKKELEQLETLFAQENIACLNSSTLSIEEMATKILTMAGLAGHRS